MHMTAVALLTIASLCNLLGWYGERQKHLADVAMLQESYATEKAKAASEALARINAAKSRSDELENRLAASESARQIAKQETSREISRLTTGRPCLGADAVRLLNRTIGPEPATRLMPDTSSGPVATDGPAATDTDVGQWITAASSQYATCRERLDALIDWHLKPSVSAQK